MTTAETQAKILWKYPDPIPFDEDLRQIAKFQKIAALSGIFAAVVTTAACGLYFGCGSYFALIPAGASIPAWIILAISIVKACQKPATFVKKPLTTVAKLDTEGVEYRSFKTFRPNMNFSEGIAEFKNTDNNEFHVISLKETNKLRFNHDYLKVQKSTFIMGDGVTRHQKNEIYFAYPDDKLHAQVAGLAIGDLSGPASVLIFPDGASDYTGARVFLEPRNELLRESALSYYYQAIYLVFSELVQKNKTNAPPRIHIPIPLEFNLSTRALVTLFIAAAMNSHVDLVFEPPGICLSPKERLTKEILHSLMGECSMDKNPSETIQRILSKKENSWLQ